MTSLKERLDVDFRVFHAKDADGSTNSYRIIWCGSMSSSMREEKAICSWEAHASITRQVWRIDEGTPVDMPEMTMPVHKGEGFDLENSRSGDYEECSEHYESDLKRIRKRLNDSLQN